MVDISGAEHVLSLAKIAGEVGTSLFTFRKTLADREEKHALDEIIDKVQDLKRQALELEDENRELREQLRFRTEDFDFKNPFYYDRKYPDRPLCAQCFAKKTIAPMGELKSPPGERAARRCLVCDNYVTLGEGVRNYRTFDPDPSPWS